jgi:hypothetical protein
MNDKLGRMKLTIANCIAKCLTYVSGRSGSHKAHLISPGSPKKATALIPTPG